ncbi:MAG TPA: hypothetical protein VMD02_03440 [Candidatus Omnitrophota bacterium]|nr:hypothetical protein [Candidatus Omnitrophota bacterium]
MKKILIAIFTTYIFTVCAQAANVEVKLDSSDGSTGMVVKNLIGNGVAIIDSLGNLGVGTTAPKQTLDVKGYFRLGAGSESTNEAFLLYSPNIGYSILSAGGRATSEFRIVQSNNAPLTLQTNGLERMRITGAGYVGIGTKEPSTLIALSVQAPNSGGAVLGFYNPQCYGAIGFPTYALYGKTTQGGYGVYSDASGAASVGVYGKGDLTGVQGINNSSGGTAVMATQSGAGYAVQSTGGINYFSGDVGIGTTNTSNYKLHVADTLTNGYVAWFENLDTGTGGDGIKIQLGPDANPGTGNHFISFCDGNGTEIGSVKGTGAASVNYSTVGGDYAEYFDAEEDVLPGCLVGLNPLSGKARAWRAGDPFMGIVSTAPGFTGNTNYSGANKKTVLVALVGQVEVNDISKIITEKGIVKTTDGQRIGYQLANGKVWLKY